MHRHGALQRRPGRHARADALMDRRRPLNWRSTRANHGELHRRPRPWRRRMPRPADRGSTLPGDVLLTTTSQALGLVRAHARHVPRLRAVEAKPGKVLGNPGRHRVRRQRAITTPLPLLIAARQLPRAHRGAPCRLLAKDQGGHPSNTLRARRGRCHLIHHDLRH
jgi:hypothetical protein